MTDRIRTRFLVIGSGVAGLHTAWRASEHGDVIAADEAIAVRQRHRVRAGRHRRGARRGRLAGAAPAGHARRGRRAVRRGGGARCSSKKDRRACASCRPPARSSISIRAGGSRSAARRRTRRTASCTRTATRPAPRSRARSSRACAPAKQIRVLEKTRVLDLIVWRGACVGVRASVTGRATEIIADATVLATGGCGQVYRYTTNPVVATGDGYAIAHRAGVTLADMEFVQFHPTALDTPENPLALISEAVRGEGAILVNARGVRFMRRRHRARRAGAARRRGARDLPRAARTGPCLSTRGKLGARFAKRFPGIFALCAARGIDPRKDLIPVTPAAHYMMGGIVTDLRGRSSAQAAVRVRRSGAHRRARRESARVELAARGTRVRRARGARSVGESAAHARCRRTKTWNVPRLTDRGAAQVAADSIRMVMWDYAGIVRTARGLRDGDRAARRDRRATAGRRDRGGEHAADGASRRRGGGATARVARRTLPRGLSAREDELAGAAHRVVAFSHEERRCGRSVGMERRGGLAGGIRRERAGYRGRTRSTPIARYKLRLLGTFDEQSGDPIDGVEVMDVASGTTALTTKAGTLPLSSCPTACRCFVCASSDSLRSR